MGFFANLYTDHSAIRRMSMKKQRAVSSFSDLDSEYAMQKFRLHSKDSSTDDYLILKVKKSTSCSSLASPHSPSTETHSLCDRTNREHLVGNGNVSTSAENATDDVEIDSPASTQQGSSIQWRKFSEQLTSSNPGSGVLLRKQMNDKKSHSLPSEVSQYSRLP